MRAPRILETRVTDWRGVTRAAATKASPVVLVPSGFRLGGLATIKRVEARKRTTKGGRRKASA